MRKTFFVGVCAVLLASFGSVVWQLMRLGLPESDLWWMMPAMHAYTEGRSGAEIFSYLLGALPIGFAQPILKLYLYLGDAWLGSGVRWLILVSAFLHVVCTALVYLWSRRLELHRREAWLAAVLYFSIAVHFHAIFWPTASQHLVAVLTMLLWLVLYLETEQRAGRGIPFGWAYAGTLAVGLSASLQRSTVIAAALIGCHLLLCARDREDRIRACLRWAPLGLAYLLYPTWVLTQVGDPVVTEVVRKLPLPDLLKSFLVVDPMVPHPIPAWVRTAVVWVGGAAGLGFSVLLLRVVGTRIRLGRGWRRALAVLFCSAVVACWLRQDSRQILLPYNLLNPLLAATASFLEPVRAVLSIRTTAPFHYFPSQVSPWGLTLTLAGVLFLWKGLLPRSPHMILLPAWYLLTTVLTLHQNSSFPLQTPSRYFIYVTPVACVLLGALLHACFAWRAGPARQAGRWTWTRDAALCGVVGLLGLSNIAAIQVALFRGRLTNTYLAYDDLRVARLVGEDIRATGGAAKAADGAIRVSGIVPMSVRDVWKDFPPEVPDGYDNLFFLARGAGESLTLRGLHPGQASAEGIPADYRVEGPLLLRRDGRNADPFVRRLEEGLHALKGGRLEQARRSFVEAVQMRPFLLRYLLGRCRLQDVRWLTDGLDLEDWLQRLEAAYGPWEISQQEKARQVRLVIRRETSDFALCLFLLSYVDDARGARAQSQHWFSQIQFLDRDRKRLERRIGATPAVQGEPLLARFLHERVWDPRFFTEPFWWKKEDYAFGRFLLRLWFGWDIQSSWDRRFYPTL